ncbi:MAG: hypothetical protein QXT27_03330 [Pyrobaculum sp.]
MKYLLLALLIVQLVAASTTVVMTYTTKPWGDTILTTMTRELIINKGPHAVEVSGVVVPPYTVITIEKEVQNIYPPFIKIDLSIDFVNATLDREILYADESSLVKISLRFTSLLKIAVPVIVSINIDDNIAVLFDTPPTSISQISGMRVYYWTILVEDSSTFELSLKIKRFGSFGATRLPTIVVTSALELNQTVRNIEKQIENFRSAYLYTSNLSAAMTQFTDIVYGQINNLSQLIQIFRLTGSALLQGADGVNMSAYALEALRRQILALGNAAETVARVINQSLLLLDYQYVALITTANLLETQSAALVSYKNAAQEADQAVVKNKEALLQIRRDLIQISQQIDRTIYEVQKTKDITRLLPNNVTAVVDQAIDNVVIQLRTLKNSVDALISTLDAAISALEATSSTLRSTQKSLGEIAPLLNSTAASTRQNATVLKNEMPIILANASSNLYQLARQLYIVGEDVLKLLTPLANASNILKNVGITLLRSADDLEAFRRQQMEALPKVGGLQSIVLNFSDTLRREIENLKLQREVVKKYNSVVNVSRVEVQYYVELPVAMKNTTIPTPRYVERKDLQTNNIQNLAGLLVIPLLAGFVIILLKLRS